MMMMNRLRSATSPCSLATGSVGSVGGVSVSRVLVGAMVGFAAAETGKEGGTGGYGGGCVGHFGGWI